jgi:hypothetical protein
MKQHRENKKQKEYIDIKNDYIKDLQDWTENRYNPGFYTGGTIPPYIKYPKKPFGVLLIISGVMEFIIGFVARISGSETLSVFLIFIASILSLVAGFFIVWKKETPKDKK